MIKTLYCVNSWLQHVSKSCVSNTIVPNQLLGGRGKGFSSSEPALWVFVHDPLSWNNNISLACRRGPWHIVSVRCSQYFISASEVRCMSAYLRLIVPSMDIRQPMMISYGLKSNPFMGLDWMLHKTDGKALTHDILLWCNFDNQCFKVWFWCPTCPDVCMGNEASIKYSAFSWLLDNLASEVSSTVCMNAFPNEGRKP